MQNFSKWVNEGDYSPDGKLFDIGRSCRKSIMNYLNGISPLECGLKSERDNGNGSLMRIAPLPLYLFQKFKESAMDKEESFSLIHNVSRLTHGHAISLIGCDIYCSLMIEILKGTKKEALQGYGLPKIGAYIKNHSKYEASREKYERMFHLDFKDIPEEQIHSSGYVVDTMEAALWCFLNTNNYRDCVLKAVNLGNDTDTVACVAGSIAGLYYGEIPAEWIKTIRNKKLVDEVIENFSNAVLG